MSKVKSKSTTRNSRNYKDLKSKDLVGERTGGPVQVAEETKQM
jgi:hypothetical protein